MTNNSVSNDAVSVSNADVHEALEERHGIDWYFYCLKHYADGEGRARRREFWMFFLFSVLISMGIGLLEAFAHIGTWPGLLYNLAILVPSFAVGARRMHDTDRSGWWQIVPIVGFVFLVLNSHPGENRFGPNPKGE